MVGSRNKAQTLIKSGKVLVNGEPCLNVSKNVTESDKIEVFGSVPVSRAYYKLRQALTEFDIELTGKTCIDVGASTGGFCQCLLENNVKFIYAIDVGTEQFRLNDARIMSLEQTDFRNFRCEEVDFITVDVSFISLKLILPKVYELLKPQGECVALIKPQFELSGKGDKLVKIDKIVENIRKFSARYFTVKGLIKSDTVGSSGNVEYLIHLKKDSF
jgi:23S rRNA (cytidine1920-2'-O)/16S rRNA (cytidine1409-2'-O)-methyltransferase